MSMLQRLFRSFLVSVKNKVWHRVLIQFGRHRFMSKERASIDTLELIVCYLWTRLDISLLNSGKNGCILDIVTRPAMDG